jgi:hypothetical protein
METPTHRFTWHLSFKWTWRPYARDAFLDGGQRGVADGALHP